jgi:YVTN family beta-propeller protein
VDWIGFSIQGPGPHTIALESALPNITGTLAIDGTSQPGFTTTPIIELNGQAVAATGLTISASNSVVRGLVINRFGGAGILLAANNNVIEGNFIGTDVTGTIARPNLGSGVVVNQPNNVIGSTAAGGRNVISGNNGSGVLLSGGSPNGNQVIGNIIGADVTGTVAVPNGVAGVNISGGSGNAVGGAAIGRPNVIAFNNGPGIVVASGAGNAVTRNSIFGNTGLGIDLGATGITPNDAGDTDTGANDLLNFPVLTSATPNGAQTTVQGTFNSLPQVATFSIEIFGNSACDPSGNGEGQTFIAATNVTTDATGNATFSVTIPSSAVYTATATNSVGNTSEFSGCRTAVTPPMTFTVINTNDSGPGSLRQAMIDARNNPGVDTVAFNIPGNGPHTIQLLGELTNNAGSDGVIIDGTTQPGWSLVQRPVIEIDGSLAGGDARAFVFGGGNSVLRGLAINRFGTTPGGTGTDRFLGLGSAIFLGGTGNSVVEGCFIGTDVTGTIARPNRNDGIDVISAGNRIGGPGAAQRNVISGNGRDGIFASLGTGNANVIQNNIIGLDVNGAVDLGNGAHGVNISTGPGATIQQNVIAGNNQNGIQYSSTGALIAGNVIGTNSSLVSGLGNTLNGISFSAATGASVTSNTIAFNGSSGVLVSATSNTDNITANSIFSNGGLGIDLSPPGVTPNDAGDADPGANGLQNFPVLTSAQMDTIGIRVDGTLSSAPGTYRIDFYHSATCDPSGNGEGQTFMGSAQVMTASGIASINTLLPFFGTGFVTATATSAGNTSEFSPCRAVIPVDFSNLRAYVAHGSGRVTVVNAALNSVIGTVVVGSGSTDVALNASGSRAFVTNTGSNSVSVINTSTNTVVGTITGLTTPIMIATNPARPLAYVTGNLATLYVIDTAASSLVTSIPIAGAMDVVVSPDGARAYVSSTTGNSVVVLDTATNTVVTTVPINGAGGQIALSPAGDRVYVSRTSGGAAVSVIDTATNTLLQSVPVTNADAIAVAPDNSQVYVANFNGESVARISTSSLTVIATFASNSPQAIAMLPGGRAYIGEIDDGVVSVVSLATNTVTTSFTTQPQLSAIAVAAINIPPPQIFQVTTAADSGPGSFRQAIVDANANEGAFDTIAFNIPGPGPHTIAPLSFLPVVTDPVNIDGTTEPDYVAPGPPVIELDGTSAGGNSNAIHITSGSSVVRGLVVNRFGTGGSGGGGGGIVLAGPGGNIIQGNYIGTDLTGTIARANRTDGVWMDGPSNVIGGDAIASPATRNVISGNNGRGVMISGANATSNAIVGNYIGLDRTGTVDLGNGSDGIQVFGALGAIIGGATAGSANVISGNNGNGISFQSNATGGIVQSNLIGTNALGTAAVGNTQNGISIVTGASHVIGGSTAASRNVISGNQTSGVFINNSTTNFVQGNYIGTNVTGTSPIPNLTAGVSIQANSNTIGGSAAGARNVISGNATGVLISSGSTSNLVQGNAIGTAADGVSSLPNTGDGVLVSSGTNNDIGGLPLQQQGNIIAFNGGRGVGVTAGTGNRINYNAIRNNGGLAIDLGGVGVTANDLNDPDLGANNLMNYPVIASATVDAGVTTVGGQLNSLTNRTYTIHFYSVAQCDATGFGEGDTFIAQIAVSTTAATNTVSFSASLPAQAAGSFITATANSTDGTSEFSACVAVVAGPPPILWTGAVSTDWSNAGNWNPTGVPSGVSFVRIPVTTNQPTVTGVSTVNDLVIDVGANVTQNASVTLTVNRDAVINGTLTQNNSSTFVVGRDLFVSGQITGSGTSLNPSIVRLNGAANRLRGTISNFVLEVTGTTTIVGPTNVGNDIDITGTLIIGPNTISGPDAVRTLGNGVIVMDNALGVISGVESCIFSGGVSTLTAGSIGCETVSQSGNPASLSAGPNHRFTVILGIGFANPGPGANESHFGRLNTNGAAIQMSSDVYVLGRVEGETATGLVMSVTGTGANRLLSAGGISMNSVLFNNVRLSVGSDIALFGNATFTNQNPAATQLEIAHPGAATPLTFNNVTFNTVATTGLYISATDTNPGDGVPLVINLRNPLPANGATRTMLTGGATVNWGDLSLRTPATNLGVGRTFAATVSLAQPAPAGGRLVTLASTNSSFASVSPPNVLVPEGASDATFTVTGVAVGSVTLTASAPGLQSTTVSLTVSSNLIILGTGVVLTVGQGPQPLPVNLSAPATGFAQIVLTSSNPGVATVTPSVSISTGQQGPVNATLSAVSPGVVTITATGSNLGPDVTTVHVVPGTQVSRSWTGTASTDWSNAANWSPAGVPTSNDIVTISSGTPFQPTITANSTVRHVTVNTGATVTMGTSASLTVLGSASALGRIDGGPIILAGTGTVTGNLDGDVDVTGIYTAFGTLTIGDGFDVYGRFDVADATVLCDDFHTRDDGILVMQNGAGSLDANDVDFEGGVSLLTAGTLSVRGDFEQLALATTRSFEAAATFNTVFSGTGDQNIFFQSTLSRFGRVVIQKPSGTLPLLSNVNMLGQLVSAPTSVTQFVGSGAERMLLANGGTDADGVVFDNVRVGLAAPTPAALARFDNATFQNMAPTTTQLFVNTNGTFTFSGVRFLSTPTTGFYVAAAPAPLTTTLVVNLSNSQPPNGSAFTQVQPGATVNWIP